VRNRRNDFRDRDSLETIEGLLFTVVGNIHPEDRIIAYLKYYPSPNGKWARAGVKFERAIKYYDIPHLKETIELLTSRYPHYLYKDELFGISFTAVATKSIKNHYLPEEKLRCLSMSTDLDELQRKAVNLAIALSKRSGVQLGKFGVTGSLLVDVHQLKFSDIDLTTYGKKNGLIVRKTLPELLNGQDPRIKRISGEEMPTPARQARLHFMNKEQCRLFYERKWNRGSFMGTPFSVNPVLEPDDLRERYGQYRYIPLGMVEAHAIVADASESIFVPAKYLVSNAKVTRGNVVEDIDEIVSYDRDYGDVAYEEEKILVRGKLERVENTLDKSFCHRIVVGSLESGGEEFIKVAT
jgi:predicted nucleotidyltransferase